MSKKVLKNWTTDEGFNLTREELKEGHVYLCSLRNSGEVFINKCIFSIISMTFFIDIKRT